MKALCAIRLAGAALIVVLGSSHAAAQWVTTNGPAGAQTNAFSLSGSSLFAGTAGGGVFRAADGYTRWVAVQAVAAAGPNIFAGTSGGGVFLSTNNGGSWVAVNSGLANLAVTALATDGTNLFAATGAGVFRRPLAEMIAP